jgi:hypothetical protein
LRFAERRSISVFDDAFAALLDGTLEPDLLAARLEGDASRAAFRNLNVVQNQKFGRAAAYQPSWREAKSFMISSAPPPMASTLVSR